MVVDSKVKNEYQTVKETDEYNALLQSVGPAELPYGLQKHASSASSIDEQIQIEMSNASATDINLKDVAADSSNARLEGENILNKARNIAEYIKTFFVFEKEFESFPELYSQLAIDAAMAATFALSFKLDRAALQLSKKCILDLEKIDSDMKYNTLGQLQRASLGEQALIKGKLKESNAATNFIEERLSGKTAVQPPSGVFVVSAWNTAKIQFQANSKVQQAPGFKSDPKVPSSLLAKLTGGIVAGISSLSALKTKIRLFGDGPKVIDTDFYFFGTKIMKDGSNILSVSNVFNSFNLSAKKKEQIALRAALVIAAGLTGYFAVKAVKNTIFLLKKKKIYKKFIKSKE